MSVVISRTGFGGTPVCCNTISTQFRQDGGCMGASRHWICFVFQCRSWILQKCIENWFRGNHHCFHVDTVCPELCQFSWAYFEINEYDLHLCLYTNTAFKQNVPLYIYKENAGKRQSTTHGGTQQPTSWLPNVYTWNRLSACCCDPLQRAWMEAFFCALHLIFIWADADRLQTTWPRISCIYAQASALDPWAMRFIFSVVTNSTYTLFCASIQYLILYFYRLFFFPSLYLLSLSESLVIFTLYNTVFLYALCLSIGWQHHQLSESRP